MVSGWRFLKSRNLEGFEGCIHRDNFDPQPSAFKGMSNIDRKVIEIITTVHIDVLLSTLWGELPH